MATVISNDKVQKHAVEKYNFKVLASGPNNVDTASKTPKSVLVNEKTDNESINQTETEIDSSSISTSSKDALIESLMKKTDDMSSNFIKLQMKLESKDEEYRLELEKVKQEAYEEGIIAGKSEASNDTKSNYTNGLAQFSASVVTLENSAKDYERALEGIKSELISAALDISKEVIKLELNISSVEIAKVLSNELIKELQSASKVTLKVNPKDHGPISEHVGSLEHVTVMSDSAVSEGGVIAISDAGNIDAQISKRFERVRRAALSE